MNYRVLESHKSEIAKLVSAYLAKKQAIEKDESIQIEVRIIKQVVITESPTQNSVLPPELDRIFSLSLRDLQFKTQRTRIVRALADNAGILTVGLLCRRFTPEGLLKYRHFGSKALASLEEALGRHDLCVGSHFGQKPGPLEAQKLKSMSVWKLGIDARICELLSTRNGYHIVAQLFPRQDFERFVHENGILTPNPAGCLQQISLALDREGIPWV